jgi:hypothetical protein
MVIPRIERSALDAPGDARPRPHGNCYWLVPGVLLAGEHPRAEGNCAQRLDALLGVGVRTFIDLTEEREEVFPYASLLRERAAGKALSAAHRRFAVRDCSVPTFVRMRSTLDAIYAAMTGGDAVYVHCWAGIGRTGTVVGCFLREQGLTNAEALLVLARKWLAMDKRSWYPRSPEWPEQFEFIEDWAA